MLWPARSFNWEKIPPPKKYVNQVKMCNDRYISQLKSWCFFSLIQKRLGQVLDVEWRKHLSPRLDTAFNLRHQNCFFSLKRKRLQIWTDITLDHYVTWSATAGPNWPTYQQMLQAKMCCTPPDHQCKCSGQATLQKFKKFLADRVGKSASQPEWFQFKVAGRCRGDTHWRATTCITSLRCQPGFTFSKIWKS